MTNAVANKPTRQILKDDDKPRILYVKESEVDHFILTNAGQRKAFAKLRDLERRGEVDIETMTWPPQIDQKGTPHVTVIYWKRRVLSQEEVDELSREEVEKLLQQSKTPEGTPAQQRQAEKSPVGLALTQEERELLGPWRGSGDD